MGTQPIIMVRRLAIAVGAAASVLAIVIASHAQAPHRRLPDFQVLMPDVPASIYGGQLAAAVAAFNGERFTEAQEMLQQQLGSNMLSPDERLVGYMILAQCAYADERFAEARQLMEAALSATEGAGIDMGVMADAHWLLAIAHAPAADAMTTADAVEFVRFAARFPTAAVSTYALNHVGRDATEVTDLLSELDALSRQPEAAAGYSALRLLSDICQRARMYDQAIATYRRASLLYPNSEMAAVADRMETALRQRREAIDEASMTAGG
ncbi:MAG TPA: hypothetical protein DGT21_25210 [Armatimonadetes bacterium]|jgi:tetratricopeptide (TPR) repeat protein|nr:hypothetical protein [Armatimonadota bacterium]